MTDLANRATALYRFFGSCGKPLYYGVAVNPEQRWSDHEDSEWWAQVDHGRTTVEWFCNRAEAFRAEELAIKADLPAFNRTFTNYRRDEGVGITQARRDFANILDKAAEGEVIYITARGRRVAAIVPVAIAEKAVQKKAPPE